MAWWETAIKMLPFIGDAVGGAISTKAQKDINRDNINAFHENVNKQRDWALQDWEKVNRYNAPEQQMQRFKEAGLNPHLIYGNANNSPSAMIRETGGTPPPKSAQGLIAGAQQISNMGAHASNAYFANANLENDTALKKAQILNLKSQSDKNNAQTAVTNKSFEDLIMEPWFRNRNMAAGIELKDAQRNTLPTRQMAIDKYLAETAKTDANAKHALQLYELAKQEGKLKQKDIDMLESLSTAPMGLKYIIELLRIALK